MCISIRKYILPHIILITHSTFLSSIQGKSEKMAIQENLEGGDNSNKSMLELSSFYFSLF